MIKKRHFLSLDRYIVVIARLVYCKSAHLDGIVADALAVGEVLHLHAHAHAHSADRHSIQHYHHDDIDDISITIIISIVSREGEEEKQDKTRQETPSSRAAAQLSQLYSQSSRGQSWSSSCRRSSSYPQPAARSVDHS